MAKKAVADKKEILKNFTEIMRSDDPDVKTSDRMKAAEFLAKHYEKDDAKNSGGTKVVIIDDISGEVHSDDEGG